MNKLHKHQICSVIPLNSKLHICAEDFVNVHKIQVVREEESYHKSRNHRWFSWYIVSNNARLHTYIQSVWNTHSIQHIHPFNGPFSGTTQVSRYRKGKTNLDFTGARDSEWQWHQLGHMQVCTSLLTDNHANTPPLSFLHAGCPSCRPTNSVKALKALYLNTSKIALTISATVYCHYFKFL